jgi:hypothetical protein
MRSLICFAFFSSFLTITAGAQEGAGPGKVVRPRTTEAREGVTLIGCVQAETRPNAFRLVVSPPDKSTADKGTTAAKLPAGIKPGASVELIARGETNLQPMANQKVEVTGKLASDKKRLDVLDARPVGACEPPR